MSRKPKKTPSYDDLEYYRSELATLQRELDIEAERSRIFAPKPIRPKKPIINPHSPIFTEILNIPIPGQSEQHEKYDGEGLPPPPRSKKSSSSKQKQIQEIIPPRINTINLPRALSQSAQTFASLNPQAKRRTTKFTKKSKGGKNKTKKRKAKKNKKTKK